VDHITPLEKPELQQSICHPAAILSVELGRGLTARHLYSERQSASQEAQCSALGDASSWPGGAAASPLAERAQQPNVFLIGYLSATSPEPTLEKIALAAPPRGLAEAGYVEGRNLMIEYRWAIDYGQLPNLAADLVRRGSPCW
jgi:hypothetical protein